MALTFSQKLSNLGMAYPQVKELASQIAAETGNEKRLVAIGFPGAQAKELVSQITLGATPPANPENRLAYVGIPQEAAKVIVAGIAAASA